MNFDDGQHASRGFNGQSTFEYLLTMHLQRINKLASTEWMGGFWYDSSIQIAAGDYTIQKYMPATHEAFVNAVEHLADMTYYYWDKDMKSFEKAYDDEKQALRDAHPDAKDAYYSALVHLCREKLFRPLISYIHQAGIISGLDGNVAEVS